jgi:hypothetical protein
MLLLLFAHNELHTLFNRIALRPFEIFPLSGGDFGESETYNISSFARPGSDIYLSRQSE